ncbi:hypothetical protein BEL04_15175 [Mucilaginibacter sp. PPCGB 2223]|uniref:DUF1572 family protein n=1 Tax=Mucilaginibacter sp. PPCGB 2223 TaxID=1886027 RepID=UPI0008257F08|nr:DUF1572 family protein [Mucilaginibacter sp. PPCGB 2223]OCX51371.1 hypothetical protein BEL04_15175 [Mucilaginibacter sp. PPCGB 2223]
MEDISTNYLDTVRKLFRYYKSVGDKAMAQVDERGIHWRYNADSNSILVVVKHIAGNSISRWTDFLTSDGEKPTRDRDDEFEGEDMSKADMLALWEKGWEALFSAIDPLTAGDLLKTVYIRNEGHTVIEAINRQLAHIPYHVGQIVFAAKMISDDPWQSLTIPKGQSKEFNKDKFASDKKNRFFTDGLKK